MKIVYAISFVAILESSDIDAYRSHLWSIRFINAEEIFPAKLVSLQGAFCNV